VLHDCGLVPVRLAIDLGGYEDDWRHVAAFRGGSGWLLIADVTVQSEHDLLRARVAVGCDDYETPIPAWRAMHLTQCGWSGLDYCTEEPPGLLDDMLCEEEGALFARWQREANGALAALHDQAQSAVVALERRVAWTVRSNERQIADLQRRRRMSESEEHRRIFRLAIGDLEEANDRAMEDLADTRATMRREADAAEERLWSRTDVLIESEPLRLVRWRDEAPRAERGRSAIWREGQFYPAPKHHDYVERAEVEDILLKAAASMRSKVAAKEVAKPVEVKPTAAELPKHSPIRQFQAKPMVQMAEQPLSAEPPQDGNWTRDRVARLRVMWAAGHSAKYIASALGGTSRNAVIGKAKRLGIFFRAGESAGQIEDEGGIAAQ
jgi:hypothetical protein